MHNLITKKGIIFVAGDYPDKKFKMTKEEVAEAVKKFTSPVPLDLNHLPRTLKRIDDRLGRLTQISHDGKGTMFGAVEIPEWLNEIACKDDEGNDLPLPVSCGFDKNKRVVKLALTDSPRVAPAAVFAAFSKAHPDEADELNQEVTLAGSGEIDSELKAATEAIVNSGAQFSPEDMATFAAEFANKVRTHEGQSVLQSVHDSLARAGAICSEAGTEFHSAEELNAIQSAHNVCVEGGAVCRMLAEGEKPYCFNSELSGISDDQIKEKNMDSEKITLANRLLAFIGGEKSAAGAELSKDLNEVEDTPVQSQKVVAPVKDTTDFSAELEAERTTRLLLEAELNELKKASIKTQASAFASEIISGKHAQESERATIEAAFAQAIEDDSTSPVEIQFSADSKGSRVDTLKSVYGSKKVVPLIEEALDDAEILLSDEGGKNSTVERQAKVAERAKALAARETKRLQGLAARK